MDLDTLAKIGEFVGGAVVVVSLLYLAIQAKQSERQQRSENYGRVVDRITEMLSIFAKDPDLNQLIITASITTDSLTPNDRLRASWLWNMVFNTYEFVYEQHKSKVLPSFVWERYSKHVDFWTAMPGVRNWWQSNPGAFSDDFSVEVEYRINREGFSEAQAVEYWGWQEYMPPNNTP